MEKVAEIANNRLDTLGCLSPGENYRYPEGSGSHLQIHPIASAVIHFGLGKNLNAPQILRRAR